MQVRQLFIIFFVAQQPIYNSGYAPGETIVVVCVVAGERFTHEDGQLDAGVWRHPPASVSRWLGHWALYIKGSHWLPDNFPIQQKDRLFL